MKNNKKKYIYEIIKNFIENYKANCDFDTEWREPIVRYADAESEYILNLKKTISSTHMLPKDVLNSAKVVIVYFVPFTKKLALSNIKGNTPSLKWAVAYEQTNAMFTQLNDFLVKKIRELGYNAKICKEAFTFDRKKLISNWSHRHFAFAAGLGTFGINNMLITKKGCCGRLNSIVSDIDIGYDFDMPLKEELCLYKKNKTCGLCMKKCPTNALTPEQYDRQKCYSVLRKNAEVYKGLGNSYEINEEDKENFEGSEVCGKCVVGMPCTFFED